MRLMAWNPYFETGLELVDAQHHAFEPFYANKAVGKGTGLGLSITWKIIREIISRHHGHIEVDRLAGQVSTFRMTLPMHRVAS